MLVVSLCMCIFPPSPFSITVISVNVSKKSVFISFLGAIKGDYEVQLYNVCNATIVKYNLSTVICRLKLTSRRSYHLGLQTRGPWVSRPWFNFARVFHTQNNCDSGKVTNILPIFGLVFNTIISPFLHLWSLLLFHLFTYGLYYYFTFSLIDNYGYYYYFTNLK